MNITDYFDLPFGVGGVTVDSPECVAFSLWLADNLPHGSGIDSNWSIVESDSEKVSAWNSYHVMADNGMYAGYVDFKLTFDLNKPERFETEIDLLAVMAMNAESRKDFEPCGGCDNCKENYDCEHMFIIDSNYFDFLEESIYFSLFD